MVNDKNKDSQLCFVRKTVKGKANLFIILVIIPVFFLIVSCCRTGTTDTPEPNPTVTTYVVTTTVEPPQDKNDLSGGEVGLLEGEIPTRTPVPTVKPGLIEEEVSRLVSEIGVDEQTFLGLGIDDWIIFGISVLGVLAGYIFGTWLIRRALPRAVMRTPTQMDDRLLEASGAELRWLVVLFALSVATMRLTFLSVVLKTALVDSYFILVLFFFLRIVWHLVELANQVISQIVIETRRKDELAPLIKLLVLIGHSIIIL